MSILNFISDEDVTLVQGVNGLFLCEESWISQRRKTILEKEDLNEEVVDTKNRSNNVNLQYMDLLDLT